MQTLKPDTKEHPFIAVLCYLWMAVVICLIFFGMKGCEEYAKVVQTETYVKARAWAKAEGHTLTHLTCYGFGYEPGMCHAGWDRSEPLRVLNCKGSCYVVRILD